MLLIVAAKQLKYKFYKNHFSFQLSKHFEVFSLFQYGSDIKQASVRLQNVAAWQKPKTLTTL